MKDELFIDINEIIDFKVPIYAHTSNKKENETLQDHTDLCKEYLIKIIKEKDIENVIENIYNILFINKDEKIRDMFIKLFVNIITFHDTGKINPIFQIDKMKNKNLTKEYKLKDYYNSDHSIYSAAFYLDYFINEIMNGFTKSAERDMLIRLCIVNGYVIERHHSSLNDYYNFVNYLYRDGKVADILEDIKSNGMGEFYKGTFYTKRLEKMATKAKNDIDDEKSLCIYTYVRLAYSILVTCDYYATNEYMNDMTMEVSQSHNIWQGFIDQYENSNLIKSIRSNKKCSGINVLRNKMFLNTEKKLLSNISENIFFLEAPTGSGKSNMAINCSLKLVKENKKKIIYVYPFNTLVEQNINSLSSIFDEEIMKNIAVINSLTPIPNEDEYIKALLDRQFMNYPFLITTHVSLFETMFGVNRESCFGFSQLVNSVIVLDEIQNYKNDIWLEIIMFLKTYAKILNMQVLIMSATLPDLDLLVDSNITSCRLMQNSKEFFEDPLFKDRVKINYELLNEEITIETLMAHVITNAKDNKKILIEFIKKETAYKFYRLLMEENLDYCIELITGDDNRIDRNKILNKIKNNSEGLILVSTQVIEAGVDIDMDIGYKDISKLDSEEQFLGRINRNCKRSGIVYFFNLDKASNIYQNDYRMDEEFTLCSSEMQEVLQSKDFDKYYSQILKSIKDDKNNSSIEGMESFMTEKIQKLNMKDISYHMKLIDDNMWNINVYISRVIEDEKGNKIDGDELWDEYIELLKNNNLPYSEKQIKLFNLKAKLYLFIYQIKKNSNIVFDDKIGELYKINNGDKFFENGKLDKSKLESIGALWIDI